MPATAFVGQYPQIPGVAVRVEAPGTVVNIESADEHALLLGDEPSHEVARAVECVVVMAHLLHRPRIVRIAAIARRDPGLVVCGREVTHAGDGGVHVADSVSASASWFSTARSSFTVPKSSRCKGVRPRSRSAVRWSIVG